MKKIAIMTDSNSGITQAEGQKMGIFVVPMPFMIDNKTYFEDINLSQTDFYEYLKSDVAISTSQPEPGDLMDRWKKILEEYDELVYIPMSSGLSGSCETAIMLAEDDDFEGRVFVVNNQRISVTQRLAVTEAMEMAQLGYDGNQIRSFLEETKFDSSIYITLNTLKYLKRGGRITPAAAALGTLLRIKPVLTIQGERLDAYAQARTYKIAKTTMMNAIKKDIASRFEGKTDPDDIVIAIAETDNFEAAEEFREEVLKEFPGHDILINPLSLSISCHIGSGSLAITVSKKHHFNKP